MNKIEIGLQILEKEYRALPFPSYSLLSNIRKYGPQALYGVKEDISDMDGIIIGSIADSLVTELRDPDNLHIIDKKPAAKALLAIKALVERTDLVETSNLLSVKNAPMVKDICTKIDYYTAKSGTEQIKVLKKYNKYVQALQAHGNDALIASKYQYRIAQDLSKALFLRYPFLKQTDNIIPQVKLVGSVNNCEIKGMLDFVYINHKTKTIIPFDLKTGIGPHFNFFDNGYLGWGYYIQATLYRELLIQALSTHAELSGYQVDNFRFMYCGREDKLPIIYKVTDKQHEAGLTGFEYKKEYFPGVNELISEFTHYKQRPNSSYRKGYETSEVVFDDSYL